MSLGVKQLKADPWSTVEEKYPVSSKAIGNVVSITDYGVFIALEEGVEGLVHVSEMSWSKKTKHPSKLVAVGDAIEVVVLNIDVDAKRISLGMKQLQPNPWDLVSENYPVGSIIEGKIKNTPIYFLEHNALYDRKYIYGTREKAYDDNHVRFALLSRAALRICEYLNWWPHVFHAHDWQTALIPVFLTYPLNLY